jgi:photosystem II stability/assembly factor-like uncharacterized protein
LGTVRRFVLPILASLPVALAVACDGSTTIDECNDQPTASCVATDPWQLLQESPTPTTRDRLWDAYFLTASTGWVVGAPGDVFKTTDGGETWDHRHASATALNFRAVAFAHDQFGWVGALNRLIDPEPDAALYETRDGGVTWTNISHRIEGPEVVGLCSLFRLDNLNIYGVGRWNGPAVFVRTRDQGRTWQSTSLEPLLSGAIDVHFFTPLRGVVTGGRGLGLAEETWSVSRAVVLMTEDGGTTWQERFVSPTPGTWGWKMSFPTPDVGYIAVQGPAEVSSVLKTTDGGRTWREIAVVAGRPFGFWAVGFVTPTHGWVGGDDQVFETTDGGTTWSVRGWGQNLNRIRVVSPRLAYAVGSRVYRFEDPP